MKKTRFTEAQIVGIFYTRPWSGSYGTQKALTNIENDAGLYILESRPAEAAKDPDNYRRDDRQKQPRVL